MTTAPFAIVIPARYGATRLPGKPLRILQGKPVIQHVYECALRSHAEEVIIATDDVRILEVAETFGAQALLTSPHHRSGSDRLAEVATLQSWSDEKILVNLQGDEPFTPPAILDQVAQDLAQHPDAAISTVMTPIETTSQLLDPNLVKVVTNRQGYALYFSRAPIPWQRESWPHNPYQAPPLKSLELFYRHIGIYAYRVGFLKQFVNNPPSPLEQAESLEQLRALWYGHAIHVTLSKEKPGPGIDTEEDLQTAEHWEHGFLS